MGRFLGLWFMGLEPLRAILVAGRSCLVIFLRLVVFIQGRLVEPLRSHIERDSKAENTFLPCGPEGHAGNQIRWCVTFHVLMKRAGTLCRKPFNQLNLHLIQWLSHSAYAFLENGTVRVPSETCVPEGIAVVLL